MSEYKFWDERFSVSDCYETKCINCINKKYFWIFLEKTVDIQKALCYTITCREGEDKESQGNAICGSVGTGRRARLRIL